MNTTTHAHSTPARSLARRQMISEIRPLALSLGVLWVREHGSMKYGKQMLRDLSTRQLAEVLASAREATALRPSDGPG
jgi:hypothetical protein